MSFHQTIVGRLHALVLLRGYSLTSAAERAGRTKGWLRRKLSSQVASDPRPITTTDIDDVLTTIGGDETHLMRPVLTDIDVLLLRHLSTEGAFTRLELVALFGDECIPAVRRLQVQSLIDEGDQVRITASGRAGARVGVTVLESDKS